MKLAAMFLVVLMIQITAKASEGEFTEILRCKIQSIHGNLVSYLPVQVGDEIIIDVKQPQIKRLDFTGNTMIPVQKPLAKKVHEKTLVQYQADQYESSIDKGSLALMVRKSRDANGEAVYWARIQQVYTEKPTGMIHVGEARLSCMPVE